MTEYPTIRTNADRANLTSVREQVLPLAQAAGASATCMGHLDLVLEEAFINAASYAYEDTDGRIEIACAIRDGLFCVTLRDWGVAYDPTANIPTPVTGDFGDLTIGGVGRILMASMTEECTYVRKDGANEFTLCVSLKK